MIQFTFLDIEKKNIFDTVMKVDEYKSIGKVFSSGYKKQTGSFEEACVANFRDYDRWSNPIIKDNARYLKLMYPDSTEVFAYSMLDGAPHPKCSKLLQRRLVGLYKRTMFKKYFHKDIFYTDEDVPYHVFDLEKYSYQDVLIAASLARSLTENAEIGWLSVNLKDLCPGITPFEQVVVGCNLRYTGNGQYKLYPGGTYPGHATFNCAKRGILDQVIFRKFFKVLKRYPTLKRLTEISSLKEYEELNKVLYGGIFRSTSEILREVSKDLPCLDKAIYRDIKTHVNYLRGKTK